MLDQPVLQALLKLEVASVHHLAEVTGRSSRDIGEALTTARRAGFVMLTCRHRWNRGKWMLTPAGMRILQGKYDLPPLARADQPGMMWTKDERIRERQMRAFYKGW